MSKDTEPRRRRRGRNTRRVGLAAAALVGAVALGACNEPDNSVFNPHPTETGSPRSRPILTFLEKPVPKAVNAHLPDAVSIAVQSQDGTKDTSGMKLENQGNPNADAVITNGDPFKTPAGKQKRFFDCFVAVKNPQIDEKSNVYWSSYKDNPSRPDMALVQTKFNPDIKGVKIAQEPLSEGQKITLVYVDPATKEPQAVNGVTISPADSNELNVLTTTPIPEYGTGGSGMTPNGEYVAVITSVDPQERTVDEAIGTYGRELRGLNTDTRVYTATVEEVSLPSVQSLSIDPQDRCRT